MPIFSIILFSLYCALSIVGIAAEVKVRSALRKVLGRKVRFSPPMNVVQSLIQFPFYLCFFYWILGFFTTIYDFFHSKWIEITLERIGAYNNFTAEEEVLLAKFTADLIEKEKPKS